MVISIRFSTNHFTIPGKVPSDSLKITASANTLRGVKNGGKTATGVKPAGTRERIPFKKNNFS